MHKAELTPFNRCIIFLFSPSVSTWLPAACVVFMEVRVVFALSWNPGFEAKEILMLQVEQIYADLTELVLAIGSLGQLSSRLCSMDIKYRERSLLFGFLRGFLCLFITFKLGDLFRRVSHSSPFYKNCSNMCIVMGLWIYWCGVFISCYSRMWLASHPWQVGLKPLNQHTKLKTIIC